MEYSQNSESKLPTVELTTMNLTPGTNQWKSTADTVRRALETYGCVAVSYEKSSRSEAVFGLWEELFGLPMETKRKHTSQLLGFGYGGKYPTMPLFECFGIENDGSFQAVEDFTNLMWPHGNHKFCETIYLYSKLLMELKEMVIKMTLSSYEVGKYHDSIIGSSLYMTRLIKYGSPSSDHMIDEYDNIGLKAHRDKGFLSIIGSNEVNGLQIQTPNGEWLGFEPSPSKFVVLVGEAFMAWSNGRMYCPLHRVITRGSKERYSIGIFSFIRETLQVPEEFVDDQNPLKFKPFNNLDYLKCCNNRGPTSPSDIQSYCGI